MKKATISKIALIVSLILVAAFLVSACDAPEPRIRTAFYYTPGGPFQTNVNDEDPRRQIKCTIIFEVVDEKAVEELEGVTFKVRSAVLSVLGELTIPEITTRRNFEDLSQRLIDRINEELPTDEILFKKAYFTDFALV